MVLHTVTFIRKLLRQTDSPRNAGTTLLIRKRKTSSPSPSQAPLMLAPNAQLAVTTTMAPAGVYALTTLILNIILSK